MIKDKSDPNHALLSYLRGLPKLRWWSRWFSLLCSTYFTVPSSSSITVVLLVSTTQDTKLFSPWIGYIQLIPNPLLVIKRWLHRNACVTIPENSTNISDEKKQAPFFSPKRGLRAHQPTKGNPSKKSMVHAIGLPGKQLIVPIQAWFILFFSSVHFTWKGPLCAFYC